jgi:predicted DNA-binding ribbon-helix-helix protein
MPQIVPKYSVRIKGGKTTKISLETPFWDGLREIALKRRVTIAHLIKHIQEHRKSANLSSAIRIFVLEHHRG